MLDLILQSLYSNRLNCTSSENNANHIKSLQDFKALYKCYIIIIIIIIIIITIITTLQTTNITAAYCCSETKFTPIPNCFHPRSVPALGL